MKGKLMRTQFATGLLVAGMAAWAWAGGDGMMAPEAWHHDGDADGDGLLDGFETSRGLDPEKAVSFADGIVDESRQGPDGRSMWEIQEAETLALAAGSRADGGGASCGLLGIEVLLVLILARLRKSSSCQPGSRG